MTMKPPPPIPAECGFTTPTHRAVAIAASTACPPFFSRMSAPIFEHAAWSAATAACSNWLGSDGSGKWLLVYANSSMVFAFDKLEGWPVRCGF